MSTAANASRIQRLAIIPARGGSKGLPRKNLLQLSGKPLIAHTIEAARAACSVQRIIVSTESPEIAEISRQYGAEVPFLRPRELAGDDTPTLPVLRHVLAELKATEGCTPEIIILLQPTSPLRRPEDIDSAMALLDRSGADSVVSVCAAEHHPAWMKRLDGDRVLPFVEKGPEYMRRQDMPPLYRLNGAIYISRYKILTEENRILGEDTRGFVMNAESSVDIDTLLDLKVAALIMQERQNANA